MPSRLQELPVEFEVTEPEIGQYEYEVRVAAAGERGGHRQQQRHHLPQCHRPANPRAGPRGRSLLGHHLSATFPHAQRQVRRGRAHALRPEQRARHPQDARHRRAACAAKPRCNSRHYDVIILGRAVDSVLGPPSRQNSSATSLLDQYRQRTRRHGDLQSRARLHQRRPPANWSPSLWGGTIARERVHLDVTAGGPRACRLFGRSTKPQGGLDALPDLLDGKAPLETKPLASTFAAAAGRDDPTPEAAIIHRRYGRGQVVSIGVDGLWRWALDVQNRRRQFALRPFLGSDDPVAAGRARFHPQPPVFLPPQFRQYFARRKSLFPPRPAPARSESESFRAGHHLFWRRRGWRA